MQNEDVILRLNNQDWRGWQSVEITRQVDAISGTFSLGLVSREQQGGSLLPITKGMACEILAGDNPLINGHVNSRSEGLSKQDHSLNLSGRDKSGDVVDCSAVHKPGQWRGQNILQLATALCAPFGVSVTLEGEPGPAFSVFKLEQGETAFEALDRALKQRELFAFPTGTGDLVLAKIGSKSCETPLVLGENILNCSFSEDEKDCFSTYIVQGQQAGNDDVWGEKAAAVQAVSNDEAVARYRPLIIRAENQVNADVAKRRAAWEKTVRAGRAVSLEVSVQGWRQTNGELWPINALVQVCIPLLNVDSELLVSKVRFSKSAQGGTLTQLTLCHKDSFIPEPEDKKKKAQAKGDSWGSIEEGGDDSDNDIDSEGEE